MNKLSELYSNPYLLKLLKLKNITTIEELEKFDPHTITTWNTIPNIKNAVDLIQKTITKQGKITIFGDYDADGVLSSFILYYGIKYELQYSNVQVILPTRSEGYGLSESTTKRVLASNPSLIITVDTGITNIKEITQFSSKNIKTIIIDHHNFNEQDLPPATSIIHQNLNSTYYPENTSATVLALLVLQKLLPNNTWEKYIPYAGISVITDIMPLVGNNRLLVKQTLKQLNKRHDSLINHILKQTSREVIDIFFIGNLLGPRLNAPGRLDDPMVAFEALLASKETPLSPKTLNKLKTLENINLKRQEITKTTTEYAQKNIQKIGPVNIVILENAHDGILGLIASRITDSTKNPTLVFNTDNGIAKGSGRSPKDFNLIKFLNDYKNFFIRVGGHKHAAGYTISTENLQKLLKTLNSNTNNWEKYYLKQNSTNILTITTKDITPQLLEAISFLQPFGMDNPAPILQLTIHDLNIKTDAQNKHLFIKTQDLPNTRFIWWNYPKNILSIISKNQLTIQGHLTEELFNGNLQRNFIIKDIITSN